MNERIKSLIELAEVWNTDGDVDKCEVDLYKFAELIVEECLNLVDRGGEFVSRPKLVERIKEHFGVEE